jgi:hypothetical protein
MAIVLSFLGYSVLCFWIIFRDGADVLEGWSSFFLFGWFAASLTPDQLKFYVGISWIASLVGSIVMLAR